jgi:hypothetical protein
VLNWVIVHLPHLLPPVIAFAFLARLGLWAADQPPQHFSDEAVLEWRLERDALHAERRRPVRRSTARAGVLSLAPLVGAFGTGLAIYTFNLRNDRPSGALIWVHLVLSVLGLLVVTGKVLAIGPGRVRASLNVRKPQQAWSSVVLLVLGVPLAGTGALLVLDPSGHSTADYLHLIVSVWWTVLLQWHLWRYLGRAVSAMSRPAVAGPAIERGSTPPA